MLSGQNRLGAFIICIEWKPDVMTILITFSVGRIFWLSLYLILEDKFQTQLWHCKPETKQTICGNSQGRWCVDVEQLRQDSIYLLGYEINWQVQAGQTIREAGRQWSSRLQENFSSGARLPPQDIYCVLSLFFGEGQIIIYQGDVTLEEVARCLDADDFSGATKISLII